MAISQQTLDAARAKARALGMGEFGLVNGGSEVHPDWQALSDASGSYANSILGFETDWSLERVNQNIDSRPEIQDWFERFLTPETPKASELRVGDVIRLASGGSWGPHREGTEHTISYVYSNHAAVRSGWTVYDNEEDNASWPFELVRRAGEPEPAPELTLEQALAEGKYHADLFPIFEKWSQEAQDAGYCSEYDRLVRSIGAPTRAEVRTIVAARDGSRRRVTVPVTVHLTYDTEGPVQSDQDAADEMMAKMSTWPDIADFVAENIRTGRRRAFPSGGSLPTEGREVTIL